MSTNCRKLRRHGLAERGFTLVEIMVVVVIVGLLATVVAQAVFGHTDHAKLEKVKHDLSTIKSACDLYRIQHGRYPEDLQELVTVNEAGRRYLDLDEVPTDPYVRNPYRREMENGQIVICCDGPDGQADTEDDITTKNMSKITVDDLLKLQNTR